MAKYWFRQKTFGIGAAPNTWQGWLFTIAGAVLFLGEAASVTRIGLLVGACVMIGVAAKN